MWKSPAVSSYAPILCEASNQNPSKHFLILTPGNQECKIYFLAALYTKWTTGLTLLGLHGILMGFAKKKVWDSEFKGFTFLNISS